LGEEKGFGEDEVVWPRERVSRSAIRADRRGKKR